MSDEMPEPEESTKVFEDAPNPITILVGGIVFAIALYYIIGFTLDTFGIDFPIIQFIFATLVLIGTLGMVNSVDTKIKINKKTGWIEAENSQYIWEGYINETERFMVLERKVPGRGEQKITEYKLNLKVDDETEFDVPLDRGSARETIRFVQEAKEAVPDSDVGEELIS